MLTPSQLLDILLLPAFYLALGAWVVVSLVLLLRGLAGGRRALALARARQRLQEVGDRQLDPESERSALVALVATLPEGVLLPLGAGAPDVPGSRRLAEVIVARLGRAALEERSARPGHPRHNNRRIAAMQVLALAQTPGVTTLLARAVDDRDPEIVGASLALLGRVPDDDGRGGAHRRAQARQVRAVAHRDLSRSLRAPDRRRPAAAAASPGPERALLGRDAAVAASG